MEAIQEKYRNTISCWTGPLTLLLMAVLGSVILLHVGLIGSTMIPTLCE
jgi:hypothetical protein